MGKLANQQPRHREDNKMTKVSVKHAKLDKDQSTMLVVVTLSVVLTVFFLFATKAMISKGIYQRRALHATRSVGAQLKSNYSSAQTLYKVFVSQNPNALGGSVTGTSNLDGDNSRIVLDSLPSTYDAPALASSLEKILLGRSVSISSISVTDDPTTNSDSAQAKPQTKPFAFSFEGMTNYGNGLALMQDFERSIRPFDVNTLEISGTDSALRIKSGITTYFQPAKSLDLTATKEIK
jgi:hypothetical protein